MSNKWRQVYTELTDLIAEHSEVEIGASVVRIPESVRPEFYRLFETVRTVLVEEKSPDLLSKARVLSESYTKVEEEVMKLLGLESVSTSPSLHRFLHDPIDQLIRGLFNPLFDLLKGRIDVEKYEEGASRNIEASFRPLYQSGYEKWIALSLVKLLEANKSFQVIIEDVSVEDVLKSGGLVEERVPAPEESKALSFKHDLEVGFIVPDIIVHSARVDRYIALSSEIGTAVATASDASEKREWLPLDSVVDLGSGITLVYVDDNPEELSLVADAQKICRPDLIIECMGLKELYEKERLDKVKLHHNSLKPRLGTYIVSKEPVPEQEPEKQEVDIHILSVGFDQSKLKPIISALIGQESAQQ